MNTCWTAGSARVNGLQIAWEQLGPQHGEPLLLVVGLGGQLIHWPDSLCGALAAQGFRVIRFDHRDAGLSAGGNRGVPINLPRDWLLSRFGRCAAANYDLHDMADDVIGLCDALGVRKAHLVGVSMGGMISQIIAARHVRRVSSLCSIMSSTNHHRLPPARLDVLFGMAGIGPKPRTREQVIRRTVKMLRRVGSPAYPTPLDERRSLIGRAYDRAFRPRGVVRQTHAIVSTGSFESLLPQIKAPTQVVHGLADPLLRPVHGQRSARLIRGARLELIPGMGHDFAPALMPRWAELITANAGRA